MFNFEGRQNLGWLAALCCPSAPRGIMLLVLAALLMLAVPAAHAAGCTAFENYYTTDGDYRYYHVMVPASNFVTVDDTMIYFDEACENAVPPGFNDGFRHYPPFSGTWGPGTAFPKNGRGRKAMEICELNTDLEIAYVSNPDPDLTMFNCVGGKRLGPERERRERVFGMSKFKGTAKQALKECRKSAKLGEDARPNLAERDPASGKWHWTCWRTWEVSDAYLKRVGA